MNLDKLAVSPQEIDKHTGRIILPSIEEAEEITRSASQQTRSRRPGERAQNAARHAALLSFPPVNNSAPTPPQARIAPISPPDPSFAPQLRTPAAPLSEPQVSTYHQPPAGEGWTFTPTGLIGLCLVLVSIPLTIGTLFLLMENRDLKRDQTALQQQVTATEKQNDEIRQITAMQIQSLSSSLREDNFGAEISQMRAELAGVSRVLESLEFIEESAPEEAFADSPEVLEDQPAPAVEDEPVEEVPAEEEPLE